MATVRGWARQFWRSKARGVTVQSTGLVWNGPNHFNRAPDGMTIRLEDQVTGRMMELTLALAEVRLVAGTTRDFLERAEAFSKEKST